MRKHIAISAGVLALAFGSAQSVQAETRGYVISVWSQAMNNIDESGCPEGKSPTAPDVFKYSMTGLGMAPDEVDKMIQSQDFNLHYRKMASMRGRKDGKPVFVYKHPLSVPEPPIKLEQSKEGFGFNLDGKVGPMDFTDPLTKEAGVDNMVARILGCIDRTRGTLDAPVGNTMLRWLHYIEGNSWLLHVDNNRDAPIDFQNEENVTVTYYRGQQPPVLSASGFQRNVTYTIDPNKTLRSLTTFKGKIKDGMFLSEVTPQFKFIASTRLQPIYDFKQARLRLKFLENGDLQGFVGGYLPIPMIYFPFGDYAAQGEGLGSGDVAGIYQALQKYADTDIDKAKNGKRTRISQTWTITAVPAFLEMPAELADNRNSRWRRTTQ